MLVTIFLFFKLIFKIKIYLLNKFSFLYIISNDINIQHSSKQKLLLFNFVNTLGNAQCVITLGLITKTE
jgi:hypothetical protein